MTIPGPLDIQPALPIPETLERRDTRVFPRFWLQGWIVGQNTVSQGGGVAPWGPLMRGRETLLSVDVRTTETTLGNVRVYAVFDGAVLEALKRGPVQRDPMVVAGGRSGPSVLNGMATFNFVLPPNARDRVPLEVFLDASRVIGFDPPVTPSEPERLLSTTVAWNLEPPKRDLVFLVTPVFLRGRLWDSAIPNGQSVVRVLQDDLPGMVPCPASRIRVVQTIPVGIRSALGVVSTLDFAANVAATLQVALKVGNGMAWALDETPVDFIVAVVPAKSMHVLFGYGGFEGARYRWAGRVLIVDEGKPEAVLHELGHGLGLYTGTEQYDEAPPIGRPIEGVTAFVTERPGSGNTPRVRHFPGSWYSWYFEAGVFDVMSASDAVWASSQFVNAFSRYMELQAPTPGGADAALQGADALRDEPAPPPSRRMLRNEPETVTSVTPPQPRAERAAHTAAAPGTRRLLLEGRTRRVGPDTNQEEFIGGSLAAFEVTRFFTGVLPPSLAAVYQSRHQLRGLDAAGTPVTTQEFYLPSQSDGTWTTTFDVPATVTEYSIVRVHDEKAYLRIVGAGTLSNSILHPAAGGTLGSTLDLRWAASGSAASAATVLRHWLFFSVDGGGTWLPSGLPQVGNRLEASSGFLPRTTQLLVRLYSSDGVTSVQSDSAGVTVANRAPEVRIIEPRTGDARIAGAAWTLRATVSDPDGDATGIGQWESSNSGVLGSGASLDGIRLSPGPQVLSYTVTDAGGARGRDEVEVTVESGATVDLGLADDALQPARLDPAGGMTSRLRTGSTNALSLRLRGPAVDTRCRVRVAMRSPGNEVVWVHESHEVLEAVVENVVLISCRIPVPGRHEFTVVLDDVNPPDRDPANNTRSWTFATRSPIVTVEKPVVRLAYTLGPNDPFPPGYVMNLPAFVRLFNIGDHPLELGSPRITGADAGLFSASPPVVSGEAVRINLNYRATEVGLHEARLLIPTNDPEHPVVDVLLRGYVYFINDPQYADDDRDGILNLVEAGNGTDARKADTDEDGLPDAQEDRNQDGVLDPGESDPRHADSDGDGLADADEDANGDGIHQANETDPGRMDTDGDGMGDGAELRARTDPTVVLDHLDLGWAVTIDPMERVLRWDARQGVRYQIERSPDLVRWTVAPSGTGARNQADQTAGEDGFLEFQDPDTTAGRAWFYRASVP